MFFFELFVVSDIWSRPSHVFLTLRTITTDHRMDETPVDELFDASAASVTLPANPHPRLVAFIIDHLAFVRGIGNIKRWFNRDYLHANTAASTSDDAKINPIDLTIFIPLYTLHEFDYVKKGTLMQATNAREAIRFVDHLFETEDELDNPYIHYHLAIESLREQGPAWPQCLKFKVHTPRVGDFPNYKTQFDSNLLGQYDDDVIQYENSARYQHAHAHADEPAEMPLRLRYLIRPCIYKRFIELRPQGAGEYKLVTEDPITKIWAQLFGIDCLNVNEAELLMFNQYDISNANYDPHRSLGEEPLAHTMHLTIDTTQYEYSHAKEYRPIKTKGDHKKKHNKKKDATDDKSKEKEKTLTKDKPHSKEKQRKPRKVRQPIRDVVNENGDEIKRERFDVINYAPRGQGMLWKP